MLDSSDDARAFIRSHCRDVLATLRRDVRPELSPVLVGVDEDGSLIISTRETAIKSANVRRNGWASVCVFQDGLFENCVQAEGPASIESLPEAMEGLVR
jgi:PPOX class probable F420-dependent enzyme